MTEIPKQPISAEKDDRAFRWIASGSTALALGTAFGALACLEWRPDGSLDFQWHAMALVWIAVGIASAVLFWSSVWRADSAAAPSKGRIRLSYAVLVAATLGDVAYSLRTFPRNKVSDVYVGLAAAVVALSITGWLISRTFKAFLNSDAENKSEEAEPPHT